MKPTIPNEPVDEYTMRLSRLSNVEQSLITRISTITVFGTKDLYDFYLSYCRLPTIIELDLAERIGVTSLFAHLKTLVSIEIELALKPASHAEIESLKENITRKERLIADFKKYDEERKTHIRRLEKRIITLRNKNQELNKRINSKSNNHAI